jgi:hypothetical protein
LGSFFTLAVFALGLSISAARAQDTVQAQEKDIDPFVAQLLKLTSDYLTSADAFRVTAEVTYDEVLTSGKKMQLARTVEVMLRRPDRVRVEVRDDQGTRRVYYDGTTLSMHHLDQNVYGIVDAPDTIDEMIDTLREQYGMAVPLADLLVSDIDQSFRDNAESGTYIGLHYLQGVKHHHLLLSNQNVDYQVWIEDSARPVPNKIVITYVNEPGQPQFTAVLSEWDFAPRLPDLVFDFAPPTDADEIEFLPLATVDR